MTKTSFDQIVESIDRQLSYLHKERWAHRYAELLEAVRTNTGEAQERAKQAMRDHDKVRHNPASSRTGLIEDARKRYEADLTL